MQIIIQRGRSAQPGFSLVELMVALAISLLLLMGVVALFISSRASYETTERLSRIQENGRFALDQLVNDIRISGFNGCARGATTPARAPDFGINVLRGNTDLRWNFSVPAQAYNTIGTDWSPTFNANLLSPAANLAGDVLVVRIPRREARAMQLRVKQTNPTDPLTVGTVTPAPLQAGDIAMITDCTARAFFQVTGYAGGQLLHADVATSSGATVVTPGNSNTSLLHPFLIGAEIIPVNTLVYYLAPSDEDGDGNDNNNDPDRMSLWRKTSGMVRSDEIAQGIDRLEVQFGIDTSTPRDYRVDTYVSPAGVTDWSAVLNAQIAILARAPEAYGTDIDNQTYTLFAAPNLVQAGPFNDRNQRKIFTATVALRNQIID